MITLEDCIAFCGLTEQEVLAIAEHEHIPEVAAAALADAMDAMFRVQKELVRVGVYSGMLSDQDTRESARRSSIDW